MIKTVWIATLVAAVSASFLPGGALEGDADRGRRLFTESRCATCHSVNGKGGESAPALNPRAGGPFSPNGMAGAMWSHAIKMWQAADQAGLKIPALSEQQAADIHAFVAGKPRPDNPGNAARGREVYHGKLCASCHDESMLGAPNLAAQAGSFSSYRMMAALTAHGRGMLSRMVAKNAAWQTLTPAEMGDLIAYLNNRR